MKKFIVSAAIASFGLATAASAGIVTVTLAGGDDGTFNNNPVGAYSGSSTAVYNDVAGPIRFIAGADTTGVTLGTSGQAATPFGDATNYLWGLNAGTTVYFGNAPVYSFLIHWGSVDANIPGGSGYDNVLTLSNGDVITGTYLTTLGFGITGSGSQTDPLNNPWLRISSTDPFTSFTATSPQNAFEFDMAAVPEPATWAMMIIGFGTVGFAMRGRRASQIRVAIA